MACRADVGQEDSWGWMDRASSAAARIENGTYGNRSILLTTRAWLVRKALGYFAGLSSPSVVLMRGGPKAAAQFYVHGDGAVDLNHCSARTNPEDCAELAVDPSDQSVSIQLTEFTPPSFTIQMKLRDTEVTVPVRVVP